MTDMTNHHAAPDSSAARIAARVNTTEPEMDHKLLHGSAAGHRTADLLGALRLRGLRAHADASAVQRALSMASSGDVDAVADELAQTLPAAWFQPPASNSASALVRQLESGVTAQRRGGQH